MKNPNPITETLGKAARAARRIIPALAMGSALTAGAWGSPGTEASLIMVSPGSINAGAQVGSKVTAILTVSNAGGTDLQVTPRVLENGTAGIRPAAGLKVLLLEAIPGFVAFEDSLRKSPNVDSLATWNGSTSLPTVAYMKGFDAVVVASNYPWFSPLGMGDLLADYVDAGGKVLLMGATFHLGGDWCLQGRILTPAYAPLAAVSYTVASASLANAISHPINQGVTALTTGLYAYNTAPQGTGKPLGTYTGGYLIGAYNPDKPIVSLNSFPETGYFGGQMMTQVRNALDFLAKGKWLSVQDEGLVKTVAPGGQVPLLVTLDAANIGGGTYTGSITLTHNDLVTVNPLIVPVTFVVDGIHRLSAAPAALDFGNRRMGTAATLSVMLANTGDEATAITGLSISGSPRFKLIGAAPTSLGGGQTISIPIEFAPDALGPQSAVLSIASDAEDNPSLTVDLSGIGTAAPSASLAPSSFTLTLSPGQAPADRTATLSNSGGDVLSWRIASIAQTGSPLPPSSLGGAGLAGGPATLPGVREDLIYADPNYAHPYVPGRVIVAFKSGAAGFAASAAAASVGIKNMRELARAMDPKTKRKAHQGRKLMMLEIQDRDGVRRAIDALRKDPNVAYAEPDYLVQAVGVPNDASFSQLYGMHNTGQTGGVPDADIDAPEAWDRHTGNRSLVIGVIDTGIDYLHPDLAANIWTNPGEIAGNGQDDDGNGYIDDIHGWDFAYDDNNPMDGHYHGTHCAGTIAGLGNNGTGVAGVMWTASLAALKFLSDSGGGTTTDAIDAVNYANAMGFAITSNSWGGGGFSQALMDAIGAGGLFIAAAGNSGTNNDTSPHYPSSYALDNVIAVAATDHSDGLASFSCFGLVSVDLGAPGVNTYSTSPGNTYRSLSGTSMATPHVSGAAGLVWTYNPTLTAAQVKAALMSSVDPIPALAGKTVTGGRLNVNKALDKAGPSWLTAAPTQPQLLAPGSSAPITVTVNPAGLAAGRWTGVVNVATDDPAHPQLPISVTADIEGCRSLSVAPSAHDFGSRFIGITATTELTLANACNDAVTISAAASDHPAFALAAALPLSVPPFGQVKVPVTFKPASVGPATASLTLTSNADSDPVKTVTLSGTGVQPPSVSVAPPSVDRTLAAGASVKVPLDISNAGGSDLQWSLANVDKASDTGTAYPASHYAFQDRDLPDQRVGNPVILGQGGPDAFGYRWIDSDQPGGPSYQWQDIKATGTPVLQGCLDCNVVRTLSFPFPLYGQSSTQMNITSKGWVNFGTPSYQWTNYPLPSTSMPNALVAAFFDDLTTSNGGVVYFQDFGDKAIVQWNKVGFYSGSGDLTFQIVLRPDGSIHFYYENMAGSVLSGTTGIQNAAANVGLQVQYNTAYVKNKLAVRISTLPTWLKASSVSGTIPAGGTEQLELTLDAASMPAGTHTQTLILSHNDPAQGPIQIPVSLTVTPSASLGASRILRVGPSAMAAAAGSRYYLWNATAGGETRGLAKGSRFTLYLK